MRIDKLLAHSGFGSRKQVKQIIKDQQVFINDKLVKTAKTLVDIEKDQVRVNDEIIYYKKNVYYMLNKPSGYVCSHDQNLYPSSLELINDFRPDLIMVGRLDVDTEGLLIITSDGKFAHQISHGKKNVFKEYYVELKKPFDQNFIGQLEAGINLNDEPLKPAKVKLLGDKSLLLSIAEGKYHQVKRMMHYCDNKVLYLRREKIGDLTLDEKLSIGQYRELSQAEIDLFL